jgi:uncharacterized protein YdhG (YjbR/CyaY superfamily)
VAAKFATIEEYVGSFSGDVQVILAEIRRVIGAVVPDAGETISYGIPTITLNGRHLVSFAAWKHHVAVYPLPEGDPEFERDLAPYRASKGTARFPLNQPIRYDLIERMIRLLAAQRTGDGQ